jgi:hypothetical protein
VHRLAGGDRPGEVELAFGRPLPRRHVHAETSATLKPVWQAASRTLAARTGLSASPGLVTKAA